MIYIFPHKKYIHNLCIRENEKRWIGPAAVPLL